MSVHLALFFSVFLLNLLYLRSRLGLQSTQHRVHHCYLQSRRPYQSLPEISSAVSFMCIHVVTVDWPIDKRVIGPLFSPINSTLKRASKNLFPFIEERLKNEAKYGKDWEERPVSISVFHPTNMDYFITYMHFQNDLLTWLLDEAPEDRKTVRDLAMRVLFVNFGAIHTSSLVSLIFWLSRGPVDISHRPSPTLYFILLPILNMPNLCEKKLKPSSVKKDGQKSPLERWGKLIVSSESLNVLTAWELVGVLLHLSSLWSSMHLLQPRWIVQSSSQTDSRSPMELFSLKEPM